MLSARADGSYRWRGEWRRPSPGRDALKAGQRKFYKTVACQHCGTFECYASSSRCVQCTKTGQAPFGADVLAIVDEMAVAVCASLGCQPHSAPIRVLLASLFAGSGAVRIAASLKLPQVGVVQMGERFRKGGIWNWSGPVPETVQDGWMGEHGDITLLLDAMVGIGELHRTRDGRYLHP